MAHATTGRSGRARNKAGDGFFAVGLDPAGCFYLGVAADFTDEDDAVRLGVGVEEFDDVEVVGAVDRVAADADAGGLADVFGGELEDGFVGERAGAGDDADVAFFVNVAGGDADAAAAEGVFAGAGGDDAGAIGADEAGLGAGHGAFHADHVFDRNALGDGDGEVEAGVDAFKDGVGGERRWHKDDRDGGAGGFGGVGDRVVDGHFVGAVFKELAAFAGGDAGDDLRAVVEGELGVTTAEVAGDALDDDLRFGSDENGHGSGGAEV